MLIHIFCSLACPIFLRCVLKKMISIVFVCLVLNITGVDMYIFKFAAYYSESISGLEAEAFCRDINGSLLYLTEYTKDDLMQRLIAVDINKTTDQMKLWTRHRVSKEKFQQDKQYNGTLPLEDDDKDFNQNTLCIYATLWLWTETVTWLPVNCDYQLDDSGVFCLFVDNANLDRGGKSERWIATLFMEAVTWDEAQNYCERQGAKLIEIDHKSVYEVDLLKLLHTKTWLEQSVSRFWVGQKTLHSTNQYKTLSEIPNTSNGNEIYCAFVDVKYPGWGYADLTWTSSDCTSKIPFICKCRSETDSLFIIELVNKYWQGYSFKNEGPFTITQCKSELKRLIQEGHLIPGFNYHKTNSTCMFYGNSFTNNGDIYDNEEYNIVSFNENFGAVEQFSTTAGNQLPCWKPLEKSERFSEAMTSNFGTDNSTIYVQMTPLKQNIKTSVPFSSEGVYAGVVMVITAMLASLATVLKIIISMIAGVVTDLKENEDLASNEDEAISEVDEDENDDYIDHGWTHTSLSVICNNIPPSLHIYPTYLILKK